VAQFVIVMVIARVTVIVIVSADTAATTAAAGIIIIVPGAVAVSCESLTDCNRCRTERRTCAGHSVPAYLHILI